MLIIINIKLNSNMINTRTCQKWSAAPSYEQYLTEKPLIFFFLILLYNVNLMIIFIFINFLIV